MEALAAKVKDNEGVYSGAPAFTGLRCSLLEPGRKRTIVGLTKRQQCKPYSKNRIGKYCLPNHGCTIKAMEADAGISIKELRVDGGATVIILLMQFQNDILNTKVLRPTVTETTALGAAYLADLAVGYWNNVEEIQQQWQIERYLSLR